MSHSDTERGNLYLDDQEQQSYMGCKSVQNKLDGRVEAGKYTFQIRFTDKFKSQNFLFTSEWQFYK